MRETWGAWPHAMGGVQRDSLRFRADGEYQNEHGAWSWRPSIHMPRWASRITLEITGVRVERLKDISEYDSLAEGIYQQQNPICYGPPTGKNCNQYHLTPREAYKALWESINSAESWAANPWVWVISFRRIP